jgi:CRP/FNR family transcriptional regulator, cyclic AMP receptor protein
VWSSFVYFVSFAPFVVTISNLSVLGMVQNRALQLGNVAPPSRRCPAYCRLEGGATLSANGQVRLKHALAPTVVRLMLVDPAILRRVSFCAELPEPALRDLEAISIPLTRPAGANLLLEGEPAEAMYIVTSGHVKVSRLASSGREQVLTVIGPGGHFNTVAIFDGGACPANADALSAVALLALPRAALLKVMELHPPLMRAFLRELAGSLRHMVKLVDTLALHTVQGRLAGLLIDQAEAAARNEPTPPMTQAEMAARLGTVREMIGRTLKGFEAQGLIRLDRGAIMVLDWAGLAEQRDR